MRLEVGKGGGGVGGAAAAASMTRLEMGDDGGLFLFLFSFHCFFQLMDQGPSSLLLLLLPPLYCTSFI